MNSTEKALHKYFNREAKKIERETKGPKRKNKSPEKKVVKEILSACQKIGMDLDVVEASGYDRMKKAMVHDTKVCAGYSDISGNDRLGLAVYIEAKAKGRRSSLRDAQREFLIRKINSGAFAVVADSAEYVLRVYNEWLRRKLWSRELSVLRPVNGFNANKKNPTALLLDELPKKRNRRKAVNNNKDNDLDIILE